MDKKIVVDVVIYGLDKKDKVMWKKIDKKDKAVLKIDKKDMIMWKMWWLDKKDKVLWKIDKKCGDLCIRQER